MDKGAQDLRAFYDENGYCLVKNVYSTDEVALLEREFDRIVAQITSAGEDVNARWGGPEMERLGAAKTTVLHTHNVQQYSAAWLRAFLHPGFLQVATALLGPDVILHHSKLFQKPPEVGAPFPMHQDWGYFPSEKDTMLAAIIHLTPATDEMGCLRVYPGTHKLGRVPETMGSMDSELLARYPLSGATPLEAEPGDVVFFHYFTLHGSLPNTSSHTRKTVLVQMHSGDDKIEDGINHPNARLTLSGWNHKATRGSANSD